MIKKNIKYIKGRHVKMVYNKTLSRFCLLNLDTSDKDTNILSEHNHNIYLNITYQMLMLRRINSPTHE